MNELQLSDDLTTIETEIKSYQNIAGQSIFEIGRRLKHVKENDLAHGEFGKWLETVNLNHRVANQMIKVASTPELNSRMSSKLGMQALYEIATLPEPERTIEHTTSKGETKTPDEMTVKELRELKKELKDKEEQSKSLYKQINVANRKIEELENAEPEVIERYMEPEDYQSIKNMNEHLQSEREYYKKQADGFRQEAEDAVKKSGITVSQKEEVSTSDLNYTVSLMLENISHFVQDNFDLIDKEKVITSFHQTMNGIENYKGDI